MLFATLAILFIVFVIIAGLVTACAVAALSVFFGLTLRSSRHRWLYPFLVWIPSLAAAFAVSFTAYSAYALAHSWSFPEDPLEYFVALVVGEVLSIGAGFVIACRTHAKEKIKRVTH